MVPILEELWARRALVALAGLAALAIAVLAVYRVALIPPGLNERADTDARGSIEILVDSARSPIADAQRDLLPLTARAGVFARYMAGGNVVGRIAERAGVPVEQIDVAGPTPLPGQAPGVEAGAGESKPYGIEVVQQADLPILAVLTRAPRRPEALALAEAAPAAVREVVTSIQARQRTPAEKRVQFQVLGPAEAALVQEGPGAKAALLIFLVAFAFFVLAILAVPRLRDAWGESGNGSAWDERPPSEILRLRDQLGEAERPRRVGGRREP